MTEGRRSWIAFARDGNPQHAGLPEWPRYEIDRRATMRFDTGSELLEDPAGEDRAAFEAEIATVTP